MPGLVAVARQIPVQVPPVQAVGERHVARLEPGPAGRDLYHHPRGSTGPYPFRLESRVGRRLEAQEQGEQVVALDQDGQPVYHVVRDADRRARGRRQGEGQAEARRSVTYSRKTGELDPGGDLVGVEEDGGCLDGARLDVGAGLPPRQPGPSVWASC
jgi:hypothetical protein